MATLFQCSLCDRHFKLSDLEIVDSLPSERGYHYFREVKYKHRFHYLKTEDETDEVKE